MDDLVAWIREQLDEDERLARAAGGRFAGGHVWLVTDAERHPGLTGDQLGNVVTYGVPGGTLREHAAHIARFDPDRELREVEAKRRVLDEIVLLIDQMDAQIESEWGGGRAVPTGESEPLVKLLALPYSDRPGYREEWRP